jgi:hypothetical protein
MDLAPCARRVGGHPGQRSRRSKTGGGAIRNPYNAGSPFQMHLQRLLSAIRPDGGTVDASDLKSDFQKEVRVRFPLRAYNSVGSTPNFGDWGVVGVKLMLLGRAKRVALARLRRIGLCPRGSAARATDWSMKAAERRREAPALIGLGEVEIIRIGR